MNQQIQPYVVQALWIQQAITVLMAIGMIAYFVAEVLKVGTEVVGKALKK